MCSSDLVRSEYLAYLAYWRIKSENNEPTGVVPGQDATMELMTFNTSTDQSEVVQYTNFELHPNSATGKRWINGRKPIYIELEFSEPVDMYSFHLDLQDRFDNFRQMLTSDEYVQADSSLDENAEIFDYFTFADDSELAWTFKYGSGNTIVYCKLPALRLYLKQVVKGGTLMNVQSALFDAADRRVFIYATDEVGTPVACLEGNAVNTKDRLCRNDSDKFEEACGDSWLHRLCIDTVTEARLRINPFDYDNWPDVENEILDLERNGTNYGNVLQHVESFFPIVDTWTEDWDPKRLIERQVRDNTYMRDSAGSWETRTEIGTDRVDDRCLNTPYPRIFVGRAMGVYASVNGCYIQGIVVDSIGNKDASIGWVEWDWGAPPPTSPIPSYYSATNPPSGWTTTYPPVTLPTFLKSLVLSGGPLTRTTGEEATQSPTPGTWVGPTPEPPIIEMNEDGQKDKGKDKESTDKGKS